MPSGSKPGERRGGRQKGTRNKATMEREELARREVLASVEPPTGEEPDPEAAAETYRGAQAGAKEKLGKEILHEFANLFRTYAALHQPQAVQRRGPPTVDNPQGAPLFDVQGRPLVDLVGGNLAMFREFGELAVDAAKHVAQYQSPKLSAVVLGTAVETRYEITGGLPDEEDGSLIDARPTGTISLASAAGGEPGPGPAPGADQPGEVPPGAGEVLPHPRKAEGA